MGRWVGGPCREEGGYVRDGVEWSEDACYETVVIYTRLLKGTEEQTREPVWPSGRALG